MRREYSKRNVFIRDTQGGVLIYFAALMPVVLGLLGLVVDLAVWNLNKRLVQNVADIGAVAAALENKRNGRGEGRKAAAAMALANGLRLRHPRSRMMKVGKRFAASPAQVPQAEPDAIIVNIPPAQGPMTKSSDAVEVIVTRQVPAFLSAIFIKGPIIVRGRAVAVARPVDDNCRPIFREKRNYRGHDCGGSAAWDAKQPRPRQLQALKPPGRSAGSSGHDGALRDDSAANNMFYLSPHDRPGDFFESENTGDASPWVRKGPFRAFLVE